MQCDWNMKVSDKPLFGTHMCQSSVRVCLLMDSVISYKELLKMSHVHRSLTSLC